jgi:tetratricopeptide (TPR) repeat protein
MAQENPTPEPSQEEVMFQQGVSALRAEKFDSAREIFTNLLKAFPQNPDYWVWLSAAMETTKERQYCLQAALKIDPTHASARRGMSLVGGMRLEEPLPVFPMNHPNLWEARFKQATATPRPKITANPAVQLMIIVGLSVLVIIGIFIGVITINNAKSTVTQIAAVGTSRPTVTPYPTKSNQMADQPTAQRPLMELLTTPYTPTPIYAATPHGEAAGDSYNGAMRAYRNGQWENVGIMMAQVATAQPGSADALYFIGESKRLSGKDTEAITYYNLAILTNPKFAPSYLGRARSNIILNNQNIVLADLNLAIKNDPNYAEAYMERGLFYLQKPDLKAAQADLEHAASMQDSPMIELNLAKLLLAQGENGAALLAATKANKMDVTMLEGYLVLGIAYRENNQINEAVSVLETYTKYQPDNAEAYAMLGSAYLGNKDYVRAKENLDKAIQMNKNNPDIYFWMGQTNLVLKEYDKALENFFKAREMSPNSFEVSEGLAKTYMAQGKYNNSYMAILKMEKIAEKPALRARFLYIRAQSLDQLNEINAALRDWTEILSMPSEVTGDEMRQVATKRLAESKTGTPVKLTVTPTAIRSVTPTP